MGAGVKYFDFAEDDYEFFRENYDNGRKRGALAALGQLICERYLKHIISEYANPETETEEFKKENILKTHSLNRLITYIEEEMEIIISEEIKTALITIDGYYFTTRYPGDDSFIASEEDVDRANTAIEKTRAFVLDKCKKLESLEQENIIVDDHDER